MRRIIVVLSLAVLVCFSGRPAELPPPRINAMGVSNGLRVLTITPAPAIESYSVGASTHAAGPFTNVPSGSLSGLTWRGSNDAHSAFYQATATPLSSNALLTATVLNRLAYGPTPDELERLAQIGPQAYIDEQLAPETISDSIDIDVGNETNWVYVTATGHATAGRFFIYLNGAGRVLVDDAMLVRGEGAEAGTNLLVNGDFESPLAGTWALSTNFVNSSITTAASHSGNSSLEVVATAGGSGFGNSIQQQYLPSVSSTQEWTLSFWYLPNTNNATTRTLTVRLSGSLTAATVYTTPVPTPASLHARLTNGTARLPELRAWFVQHAIGARRQLLEVLTQFWENHFVTQHEKSDEYLDRYYDYGALEDQLATAWEFREISRWREAMLDPKTTFHDLLTISAESPAMIVYLDTVNSRGDRNNIANENYARELLELFCHGVDNGYDQDDIVVMSRAWTGWSVDIVDATNQFNPFAPRSTTYIVPNGNTSRSNLLGVWTFVFKQGNHNTNSKTIFPGKTVPARFGTPWAGQNYQLTLPARNGTNGIQDGYAVLAHLANLPFTQEFISVKLCRLFVHDDFVHGTYDYTAAELSPEATLVRDCMLVWENSNGNLRAVLATIFNSELFRSHGGSLQKVKTPLEFTASAVRALRSRTPLGTYTAGTDGYSISGRTRFPTSAPLTRMGTMLLFDRAEPDGYPETGPAWISAGSLAERIRFVQTLLLAPGASGKTDGISGGNFNVAHPVPLLEAKLPAADWKNATAVADYFVNILYPGEGRGNLALYRDAAAQFLETDDAGALSPFSSLSSSAYDTRVRGMVAMLMTLQRFQEQ